MSRLRRHFIWALAIVGLLVVQMVFLLVQMRQAESLSRGVENVALSRNAPIDAPLLTSVLNGFVDLRWIRCYQLSELIPPVVHSSIPCAGSSWIQGVAPAEFEMIGAGNKLFRIKFEALPSPEFEGLLWIARAMVLMSCGLVGWAARRITRYKLIP